MDAVHKDTGRDGVNWDALFQQACQKKACAIQWCLARHNYQEKRCQHELREYQACCQRVKDEHATGKPKGAANQRSAMK
ncbi:hypothetical protein ACHHYP_13948 [Achlya hypogyna]|uniref:CHCH domain-containing protein n=1 Tax=Achlya hypogyna TaxID=1202772 RepID=A0A1V9YEF2_ACHHY|nr:hypothetical protein ACHHYP_13948 [Achlya hypogyna]